jgi:hypothetical protein
VITAVNNATFHSIVHIVVDHIAVIIVFPHHITAFMKRVGEAGHRNVMMSPQKEKVPLCLNQSVFFVELKHQKYLIAHYVDMISVLFTNSIRIIFAKLKNLENH